MFIITNNSSPKHCFNAMPGKYLSKMCWNWLGKFALIISCSDRFYEKKTKNKKPEEEIVCVYLLRSNSQKGQKTQLAAWKTSEMKNQMTFQHPLHNLLHWAAYNRYNMYYQILACCFSLDKLQKSFLRRRAMDKTEVTMNMVSPVVKVI